MSVTDTSEKGLESLIVSTLVGARGEVTDRTGIGAEPDLFFGGTRYVLGNPSAYDRDHAVDLEKLFEFLRATQPKVLEQLGFSEDTSKRQKFLARLQGEIAKRGIIDVLRKGIKHGPVSVDLFYGTPSPENPKAVELFAANIFSVTRQLHYSKNDNQPP